MLNEDRRVGSRTPRVPELENMGLITVTERTLADEIVDS